MLREARLLKNCKWHDVPFTSIKQGDIFMIYTSDDEDSGYLKNSSGRNVFEAIDDARVEGKAILIRIAGVVLEG
jgi:hypothetical protein